MRNLLLTFVLALGATQIQAQDDPFYEGAVDLDALYQQIDDAILKAPEYVAARERQINDCRDSLLAANNDDQRLKYTQQLFVLYKPFRNDSALHYAEQCISIAEALHRPDLVGRFRSWLAYQCSNTDRHSEALEELRKVDRKALDNAGLVDYYSAWMHVSGELANYSQRKQVRQHYFDLQNLYRDSVMMVADEGSEAWLHLKMDILSAQRQFQEALVVSDKWIRTVKDGTHEGAYAAFYRSMCYDLLENHDLARYWLGKSALDDIRCAVRDQASLLFLAERLANDGDIEHARRYMEFAKSCNTAFLPRIRAYQVNPLLSITEKCNQAASTGANLTLIITVAGIILLLMALTLIILIIRRKL